MDHRTGQRGQKRTAHAAIAGEAAHRPRGGLSIGDIVMFGKDADRVPGAEQLTPVFSLAVHLPLGGASH